jgi:phage baseplate assembly protein W
MPAKKATLYGMNPPFIGGAQNIMSRQEDERLIKNDIIQLIMTVPGERVMRPTYGMQLRTFVFENATDADLSILASDVARELTAQEPRVFVDDVSIVRDDDRNAIAIKIVVRLKKDPKKQITIENFLQLRG